MFPLLSDQPCLVAAVFLFLELLTAMSEGPIVLFDGVCNLCNRAVRFILDHEREHTLRFAALQSDAAEVLLSRVFDPDAVRAIRAGLTGDGSPDSVVLIEGGRGYTHSTAGLRVIRHLRAPWSWAAVLIVLPPPIRDLAYRFIAKNRYAWFGKRETCGLPTQDVRHRFLE